MVFIPKMPALGLMLEYPIFDSYNDRINAVKAGPSSPEYRPPIDFEVHRDKIEQFKNEYIFPKMRDVENQIGM
jgi:tRNA pseudouridine38-40 synthase